MGLKCTNRRLRITCKYDRWHSLWDQWRRVLHCPTNWWAFLLVWQQTRFLILAGKCIFWCASGMTASPSTQPNFFLGFARPSCATTTCEHFVNAIQVKIMYRWVKRHSVDYAHTELREIWQMSAAVYAELHYVALLCFSRAWYICLCLKSSLVTWKPPP